MPFLRLLAVCSALSVPGLLQAQHPMVRQKLSEWDAAAPAPERKTLVAEIEKAAAAHYKPGDGCARLTVEVDAVASATADRYVFNGIVAGQIRNGWTATVRHPGCDSGPVRYMTVQSGDGSLRTFRVNRGLSHAWESLIGDTLQFAMLAAKLKLDRDKITCNDEKTAKLGVTRVSMQEADLGPDVYGVRYVGSWSEVWPIEMCKQTIDVPVRFTADGDGGAYHNITLVPATAK
ncbi:MAG: hypothetical protein ACKVOP_06115 [Sphingomonadaceae bacterium]